jgi:putative membrane protein
MLKVLWGVVAIYAAMTLINSIRANAIPVSVLVLFLVVFVLLHGALRYRWSGILIFIAIALVVSNILENVSILTGFPFGHYYYTDALGIKLFLVPVLIGPAYIGTGYLAWVIATVLVGDVRRDSRPFMLVAVPIIASFAMVVWDLCFDPTLSTILKFWVWKQGGGYFGVPLTNYLGWFLTVYLFYQAFALAIRYGLVGRAAPTASQLMPMTYYLQAVVTYAVIGLSFAVQYLTSTSRSVTDATGAVWNTGAIHETSAIVGLYTMVFIAVLATIKLIQNASAAPVNQPDTPAIERAQPAAEPTS